MHIIVFWGYGFDVWRLISDIYWFVKFCFDEWLWHEIIYSTFDTLCVFSAHWTTANLLGCNYVAVIFFFGGFSLLTKHSMLINCDFVIFPSAKISAPGEYALYWSEIGKTSKIRSHFYSAHWKRARGRVADGRNRRKWVINVAVTIARVRITYETRALLAGARSLDGKKLFIYVSPSRRSSTTFTVCVCLLVSAIMMIKSCDAVRCVWFE